jgi:hypothetical protein
MIQFHATAKWSPPENPDKNDAQSVIREAFADTRAGRYEESLAKHLWYRNHALEIDRALVGSRLAPALIDWYELAKAYPPAMVKLRETRDDAIQQVIGGKKYAVQAFQDFSSINEHLEEESQTVDVFVRLDKDSPELAGKTYAFAQEPLIKTKSIGFAVSTFGPKKPITA